MPQVKGIRIVSHIGEVTAELQPKIHDWLEAIGMDASSTAQGKTPVDTGRLKNSIYPIVADERTVHVGTNVSYAIYIELGHHNYVGKHMIRFGCTAHVSQYKDMLEQYLKQ